MALGKNVRYLRKHEVANYVAGDEMIAVDARGANLPNCADQWQVALDKGHQWKV
jgi:hypothetical protein